MSDPIFAAIKRHKELFRKFSEASDAADHPSATDAERIALDAASKAEMEAAYALTKIKPTTIASARAAFKHLVRYDRGCEPDATVRFVHTLLQSPVFAAEKDDRVCTVEEAAAVYFEPWKHKPDEWTPPTDEEWAEMSGGELVWIRTAWHLLYKSKAEIMDAVEKLDIDAFTEMSKGISGTADFVKGLHAMLEAAEGRLIAASSSVALRQQEKLREDTDG